MSIERDIRFIAESLEWQNKVLSELLKKQINDSCNKGECRKMAHETDSTKTVEYRAFAPDTIAQSPGYQSD